MPRGIGGDPPHRGGIAGTADLVERFYAAFTKQDLDAFVAILHPEVELQSARGLREGREEARRWATKNPAGGLDQRIVLEEVIADDRGAHAVALIRKQWWWREEAVDGTEGSGPKPAHDEPGAALFTFRDGLVARWQPFADRDEALGVFEALGSGAG